MNKDEMRAELGAKNGAQNSPVLAIENLTVAYRHDGYWLDIGRPDDYERACTDFESLRPKLLP